MDQKTYIEGLDPALRDSVRLAEYVAKQKALIITQDFKIEFVGGACGLGFAHGILFALKLRRRGVPAKALEEFVKPKVA